MNEFFIVQRYSRRILTSLFEFTKDLLWSRRLFVCRIKRIIASRILSLFDKEFSSLKTYYESMYNTMRNRLIKKTKYGKLTFYIRRGDDNMIKEVFLDKDYYKLKEFYPKRGEIIVDLGAGIGDYTIFSSYLVGQKGLIISVECDKNAYSLLKKNIKKINYQI